MTKAFKTNFYLLYYLFIHLHVLLIRVQVSIHVYA